MDTPAPSAAIVADDPPSGFRPINFSRNGTRSDFNTHIGTLYGKRGEKGTSDAFVMGFRVQPHMCNPVGGLHGGMMMTVADLVAGMGTNVLTGMRRFLPTVNMTFDFVAPARVGDWVEGRCEVVRVTRNLAFAHIFLTVGERRILRASSIMKVPSDPAATPTQARD